MFLTAIKSGLPALLLAGALLLRAAPAWPETLIFKDKLGREVAIEAPCRRVLLFESYELMPVTRAWNRVAGLSRYAFKNELMLAAKPDLAETLTDAGSALDANLEKVLALNPDLIITWPNEHGDRFLDLWSSRGLTVISVYPETLGQLYELMRLHGRVFEAQQQVEAAIDEMEKIFSLIDSRLAGLEPQDRKTALWLFARPNRVAGGQGLSQVIFDAIGVKNQAEAWPDKTCDLSLEEIYARNPDLFFIWGSSPYGPEDLLHKRQWRRLKAVETGMVYKLPPWSTFSPRLAPLALMMAAAAYPERFEDVGVDSLVNDFYLKIYGFENREKGLGHD